jgi:hypothetical protein
MFQRPPSQSNRSYDGSLGTKKEAIRVELNHLLAISFIKELYHPEWLTNHILVRKKNNEWRMCIDYTDLNKHCPKDPFGLPHIDEVIDSTAGCEL